MSETRAIRCDCADHLDHLEEVYMFRSDMDAHIIMGLIKKLRDAAPDPEDEDPWWGVADRLARRGGNLYSLLRRVWHDRGFDDEYIDQTDVFVEWQIAKERFDEKYAAAFARQKEREKRENPG